MSRLKSALYSLHIWPEMWTNLKAKTTSKLQHNLVSGCNEVFVYDWVCVWVFVACKIIFFIWHVLYSRHFYVAFITSLVSLPIIHTRSLSQRTHGVCINQTFTTSLWSSHQHGKYIYKWLCAKHSNALDLIVWVNVFFCLVYLHPFASIMFTIPLQNQ